MQRLLNLAGLSAVSSFIGNISASFRKLADIAGRKRIFFTAFHYYIFNISYNPFEHHFLIITGYSGIAAAMVFGTSMAIITSFLAPENGRALGINVTAVYTGLSGACYRRISYIIFRMEKHICVSDTIGLAALLLISKTSRQNGLKQR